MKDNFDPDELKELEEKPDNITPEELNPGLEAPDNPELEESNVMNGSSETTEQSESNLPAVQSKKEKKVVTFSNDEVLLIDEILKDINKIIDDGISKNYLDVGEVLIEKIYEYDMSLMEGMEPSEETKEVKEKKIEIRARKRELFKQLTDDLKKQSKFNEELPAKTYLNNSIRLVIDDLNLGGCEEYQKLNISLKIEILRIHSKEDKIEFAKKIVKEGLSVRVARGKVSDLLPASDKDIFFQIKNVGEITNIDDFMEKELPTLISGITKFKPVKSACDRKLDYTEARIKVVEQEIAAYKKNKTYLETIKARLEEMAPTEVVKKKAKKPSTKKK